VGLSWGAYVSSNISQGICDGKSIQRFSDANLLNRGKLPPLLTAARQTVHAYLQRWQLQQLSIALSKAGITPTIA